LTSSISVVVPAYNEEDNILDLYLETKRVLLTCGIDHEIIIVDDGSTDRTSERLKTLTEDIVVTLSKNYGQTAAMAAGIAQATKELIAFLDGDGQNDPSDIPRLIEEFEKNQFDLICGWRKNRKDTFYKKIVSKGARFLRKILFEDSIHDSGCSLKVMATRNAKALELYGELHRFIPMLAKNEGLTVGEMQVNHRSRRNGKTKYNWRRVIKGYLDMLSLYFWTRYATRPLHIFGIIAIALSFIGSIGLIIWIYLHVVGSQFLKYSFPSAILFFYLSSLQILLAGLLADKLVKNGLIHKADPGYRIRNIKI
jgi:glycosyltransferase involved in cell wall biosynthesis